MSGSDCSESGGVEDVPPTTPLTPLQPPSPKTPPINEAGVNSPAHKSPVGDTGVTGLHSDPSATCGPSEKVAGFEGQEFNGPPRDSTDPRANVDEAEPTDPNRCLRPLQRARERRAARLKVGGHPDVEFRNELSADRDPSLQKPPAGACFVCDVATADDNCVYWDEDVPICKPCFHKAIFYPSFHQFCINKFAARLNSQ